MNRQDAVRHQLDQHALTLDLVERAAEALARVQAAGLSEEAEVISSALLLFKQELMRQQR